VARLPDGTEFSVGTGFSDRERSAPPGIGATITFRYQELSEAGVPRFPSYVGVRLDAPQVTASGGKPEKPAKSEKEAKSAPVPMVVTSSAPAAGTSGGPRYFEFVDDKSSKFWEITWGGTDLTTRWGKIGSTGQSKTKSFADAAAAKAAAEKLLQEKTDDGYVEKK
jgi:DNA ligase-1